MKTKKQIVNFIPNVIMSRKKTHLESWLFICCCFFFFSACTDDGNRDFELEQCNIETEYIEDIPKMNVLLFKNEAPEDIRSTDKKYIILKDDGAYLLYYSGISTTCCICNFPEKLKEWSIPASGLPLSIKGRKYDFDGASTANGAIYYLELTYIKKL